MYKMRKREKHREIDRYSFQHCVGRQDNDGDDDGDDDDNALEWF